MAISAMEQGEHKNCFYIRPPLPLKFSIFIKISLGGYYNHV